MSRVPLGLVSAALCLALSACSGLATGSGDQVPPRRVDKGATAAGRTPAAVPTPAPTKPPPQLSDLLGADGRLTVLILGSDVRKDIIGERTDAIVVASIDPSHGKVSLISLPRDTVNVPIAPGRAYPGRINATLRGVAALHGQEEDGAVEDARGPGLRLRYRDRLLRARGLRRPGTAHR